jgi:Ulp1 family protease
LIASGSRAHALIEKKLISNPSQEDGGSCGVFICAFIHAFLETKNLRGQEMLWSQKNIPFFRMFMLNRILNMSNNNE